MSSSQSSWEWRPDRHGPFSGDVDAADESPMRDATRTPIPAPSFERKDRRSIDDCSLLRYMKPPFCELSSGCAQQRLPALDARGVVRAQLCARNRDLNARFLETKPPADRYASDLPIPQIAARLASRHEVDVSVGSS